MFNRKSVFAAACLGMLLFGISLISLGTILPALIQEYNLDKQTAGTLVSILPIGILCGSVIFGPVVDRYGYKNLLILCAFFVFIGLEGFAFANSFTLLCISIFLIGFGGGVINGGTNALVSDISSQEKGANLSLLGVFFGIGALGIPVIMGLFLKTYSYHSIIGLVGLLVLIPIIYFFTVGFPTPKHSQGLPVKAGLSLLKDPIIILTGFILFFESGLEGMVNNWSTTFLQQSKGIEEGSALYALSFVMLALTVSRLILGFLLKKMQAYIVLYICVVLAFAGALLLSYAQELPLLILGAVLLGAGFSAAFPVILGYVGEIYAELSGTAFSIVIVIALLGNTILNYLVGAVAQSAGIGSFPVILMISIVLMTVLLYSVLNKLKLKIKI